MEYFPEKHFPRVRQSEMAIFPFHHCVVSEWRIGTEKEGYNDGVVIYCPILVENRREES